MAPKNNVRLASNEVYFATILDGRREWVMKDSTPTSTTVEITGDPKPMLRGLQARKTRWEELKVTISVKETQTGLIVEVKDGLPKKKKEVTAAK